MPILYSVILRGSAILTRHAATAGNFVEVTDQIMEDAPPQNEKLSFTHGNYLFHYIHEKPMLYLCITDIEFGRSRAFLFLDEIKRRFRAAYGDRALTAMPMALNSEFSRVLAHEMKHYSDSNDVDTIARVHGELDELKGIMVKNIDSISTRGERLELLVNKVDTLSSGSVGFRSASRNLARAMFWKNVKLYFIIGGIIAVIVYFIVSMSCGGLLWQGCVGKK